MSISIKDICRGVTEKHLTITEDDIEVVSTSRGDMLALHQGRWGLNALVDSHGWPEKDIRFLALPVLCNALFKVITENFYIPIDTAKIISIHTNSSEIFPYLHKYKFKPYPDKLAMVRIEADAVPCEREHDKCLECERHYRCITQRKE